MPLIPDYGKATDPAVRARYAYLQSGICLGGNFLLLFSKLYLSVIWSSVAVLGDALNHLTDVAVSIVIILAFKWAMKGADAEHPHGHGRIEHVLAVVVSSMIIFMGVLILHEAIGKLSDPTIQGSLLFAGLMVGFAGVKGLMAALSFSVARRIDSKAIRGDAWNHVTDMLISLSLAAAIFATTLGDQYRILDPIFGIVVAGFVIYAGGKLIKDSAGALIGEAPPSEMVRRVRHAAMKTDGVRDAHDIEVHDYGSMKIVSLHVVVDEHITAHEAHDIASRVENRIREATDCKPSVHIEVTEPRLTTEQIEDLVIKAVRNHRSVRECIGMNIYHRSKGGEILLTLAVDGDLSVRETDRILRKIEGEIRILLPHYRAIAKAVPHGGGQPAHPR